MNLTQQPKQYESEEDHVTGNYSFAKGGKVTEDWKACFIDGTNDTKTVWVLAPGGAVTNCNGVTVTNGSLPAGVGYGLENGKLSGKYWPNPDSIITQDKNSTVKMTFYAGGFGVPGQQVLVAVNPPSQAQQEVTQPGFASGGPKIPYEQTSIPGLGKNLGTDGWAYGEKDNGTLVDVTPTAGAPMYNFPWPNASAYALSITANNVNLDDPSIPTPTFCVGQHVFFTLNGLPDFVDAVGRWNLPGTFVNEQWQHYITDPETGLPEFYGSVNYRDNSDLLNIAGRNVGTSCWYYDKLDNGKVSMHVNLHMSNGQYVSVAADGQFIVYRPTLKGLTNPTGPACVSLYGGNTLSVGTSTGVGDLYYKIYVDSTNSGLCGITQLISGYNYGVTILYPPFVSGGDYWLDNDVFYLNHQYPIISANDCTQNGIPLDDEPKVGCIFSPSGMQYDFNDYVRFKPDGDSGNIFVTLGIISWHVSAEATKVSGVWVPDSGNLVTGPTGPDTSNAFPVWEEVFYNSLIQ